MHPCRDLGAVLRADANSGGLEPVVTAVQDKGHKVLDLLKMRGEKWEWRSLRETGALGLVLVFLV